MADRYYGRFIDKKFIYQSHVQVVVMNDSPLAEYLAENPKMVGVLFTLLLLLTQAGNAAAGWGSGCYGP